MFYDMLDFEKKINYKAFKFLNSIPHINETHKRYAQINDFILFVCNIFLDHKISRDFFFVRNFYSN